MENPNLFPGRTDPSAHFLSKGKRAKRARPIAADKEEVEDMANCLMLLSRGKNHDPLIIDDQDYQTAADRGSSSRLYRCKTCDKVFGSFQALGGHRASHKKPGNKAVLLSHCQNPNPSSTPSPRQGHAPGGVRINSKPITNKVHECSICGSEFGSGQALGGHMRRHRPVNADVASSGESYKKARSNVVMEFDLNLPAPEDSDSGDSLSYGFGFALSATSLVDCRYKRSVINQIVTV